MQVITDKASLIKLIESITKRGKALDRDIHLAGVSALAHLEAHGDIGMVNRLFLGMPKGSRKAAMTSWLLKYGRLLANTQESKVTSPFVYAKEKANDIEGSIADPWYDHSPDKKPDEVFDVQAAVMAILKKAKGKELAHGNLLAQLQALVSEDEPAGDDDTVEGESD